MKTIVSIIIPAYNVEKYIGHTLSSLLAHNSSAIEILIINDGSSDQTEQVINKTVERSGARNVMVFSKANGGVSSARNFGLDRASGEYVYFLDGDDYVADDFIDSMLTLLDRHKPQALHWPYDLVDEAGAVVRRFPYKADVASPRTGLETLNSILLDRSTRIWTGSIAYRRDLLTDHKLRFTQGCTVGEDLEFIFTALTYARSVLFSDQMKTFYLQRPSSLISTYSIRKFDAVPAMERVRDHFLHLSTPEYLLLAKHLDAYEILHYYAGTYRMCLEYLAGQGEKRAAHVLSSEIDRLYPGMRDQIAQMMRARKKKRFPDRIDVFRISPVLYMHLSRLTQRDKTQV